MASLVGFVAAVLAKIHPSALRSALIRVVQATQDEQFTRLDAGVAAHPNAEPADALLARVICGQRARWETEQRAKGKDPAKKRYQEPQEPEATELPGLPEGWCWATVEQLGVVKLGRQRSPSN